MRRAALRLIWVNAAGRGPGHGAAMSLLTFALACLALLVTPGPTNTLIALRAAQAGVAAGLRLVPAELAGYGLTVVPLALFGEELLAEFPAFGSALKLGAALWVGVLAVRLWRSAAPGQGGAGVTARQVFVTTLSNPKALIFGLVLVPAGQGGMVVLLGVFALCILSVALLWAVVARSLVQGDSGLIRRGASAVLMVFAAFLAQAGLAGVL